MDLTLAVLADLALDASAEVVLAALVGALNHRALLERQPLTPEFVRDLTDLIATGAAGAARG